MFLDVCTDAGFLIRIIVKLFKYLRFLIPIILVVFITFDLFKVMTGDADDKAKKEAFSKAVKRMIYAVIIFFIPTIITIIFRNIQSVSKDNKTSTDSTSWISCWLSEYNK